MWPDDPSEFIGYQRDVLASIHHSRREDANGWLLYLHDRCGFYDDLFEMLTFHVNVY